MTRRPASPVGHLARLLPALIVAATASCSGGPADAPAAASVDQEAFVATYVDLRATAVRSEKGTIDAEQRREILDRHGVTEAGLLAFAEEHGEDVDYMRAVWDDVEAKLDSMRLSDTGRDVPH
jgi:hypothetical protein